MFKVKTYNTFLIFFDVWYNNGMKNWIENTCVVVTGASSGIGRELSKLLISKYNCKVIGVARNEQNLNNFKAEIEKEFNKGNQFLTLSKDVSKKEDWQDIYNFATEQNVNIVINNAGTMLPFLKASNTTEEDVERVFKTNFYSIYYCFKFFNNYFENQKNCGIINITSSSSAFLIPGESVYSASKSAATKLSLITASEVKKKYFVGTYLPGFTDTNIFYSSDNSQNVFNKQKMQKILKRLSAAPQKVAKKILKFAKRKKRYKTIGKDSAALKLLNFFCRSKSSDVILSVFKASKNETFKDLF